jgi:hypothetical protein
MSVMGIYDNHKAFGHDNQSYSSVSTGYMHPSAVKLLNHFPELKEDSTLYRFSVKFLRDLSNRMLFRVLPPRRKIGLLKYHLRRMVRLKLPKK